MNKKNGFTVLAFSMAMVLSGCGGSNSNSNNSKSNDATSDNSSVVSLSGTAATGAAIKNGTITAKCTDGTGFQESVTTNNLGQWGGTLSDDSILPCALQISYGNPEQKLHSFASNAGTINITPLTDLALAIALQQDPSAWFATADAASTVTGAAISKASNDLLAVLTPEKGYIQPSGSPFTTEFNANGTGWDKLLDQLKEAIPEYELFLEDITENGLAPEAIPVVSTDPTDPTDPVEPDPSTPDGAVSKLAGSYEFSVQATGTSRGDLVGFTPRGLRSDDFYPSCSPLGVSSEESPWNARVVIKNDASVSIQNMNDPNQSFTLTPGNIDANDKTVITKVVIPYKDQDFTFYEIKRTISYQDANHSRPLQESFFIELGVDSEGKLANISTRGSDSSPRMDFCPIGFMVAKVDMLASLKALSGNYILQHDYLVGTTNAANPSWTNVDVMTDGSMSFQGDGPSFSPSDISIVRINNRKNSGNYNAEGGIWGISVILNRDLNGDSTIDKNDRVNLFLTENDELRDIQYKNANGKLVEVSVSQVQLPEYDESLNALVGNGINAKLNSNDASINASEAQSQIEPIAGFFAKRNDITVPANERRAWRVRINSNDLQTATPYSCTSGTSIAFDDSMGVLTSATGGGSVQPRYNTSAGGYCEIQLISITKSGNQVSNIKGKFRAILWDNQAKRHVPGLGYFNYDGI